MIDDHFRPRRCCGCRSEGQGYFCCAAAGNDAHQRARAEISRFEHGNPPEVIGSAHLCAGQKPFR
jgi:hypothetical protein